MENISCLDNVVEFILRTENFSPDDIDEALLFDNCTRRTIESTKFTNSDTPKNKLNNCMTKAVMESVPYADVLPYSADILSVPSFSGNYKEMDQGQQISQEPFDPTDLFEFSDEEFRQMINLRDCFNVQEEVVVQDCPKQEIIIQSLDTNRSTDVDNILETEVKCISSTVDVHIPISQGEEASSSVNPYDFSRFNQKSQVINHIMLTNHTEHQYCCVLCSVCYHRKSDLNKHMKIHKSPNNVCISDSSKFMVPIHSRSVTHVKGSENKGDILYQKPNTKKGNDHGKGQDKRKYYLTALQLYSKPHTCNPCGLSYTYKNVLFKHARLRHKDDGVNIVSTQKSNSDSYELTILANSKFNKVSYYSCDSCKAVYNRFDFFKRHQRLHISIELGNIEGETIRCIICGLLLKSLTELELHTKQHLIVTSFSKKLKCSVCDGQFGVTDEVSDHDMSKLHNDSLTEYICRLCRNLSKDDKVLQKDLIIHNTSDDNVNKNNKGVTCDMLDEEVTDNQAFINHKASHVNTINVSQNSSTIKIFPCDSCDKVFKNRSSQKIHLRLHTGERPFNCKYCIKSFADFSTRKKHERIHTGERLYACPACTRAFIQRAALCKHIQLLHAGIKIKSDNAEAYKCELCSFFCQSSTEFYLHLLQHSDENRAKSRVGTFKDQRHSKLGNQKNTCCSVPKAMPRLFDTDICKDERVPSEDEQYIQSITNEDDMRYNPMSVASPNEFQTKTFKIVNGKLETNEQKSTEQMPYRLKFTVLKSELIPKKQRFVLKDGECTRTCSTIQYYSLRSDSTGMNSSLPEKSKKNDSIIEPDDQISINYKDVTFIEKKNKQPEFVQQNYHKISNINYANVKHKYQHHSKFDNQKNTCYSVPKAISTQFDTDIYENERVPSEDKQYIRSIMNEDDMRYNPMFVASPSESQAKTFEIVNGKLEKNKQNLTEQMPYRSKYPVLESELYQKRKDL